MSKKKLIVICIAVVLTVVLIAVYFGVKFYASNVAEKKINEAIAKVVNFVDVDYKKVSVDLFGMNARISGVLVSPVRTKEKIRIDKIIIRDIDDKSYIPSFLSVSLKGIEVNLNWLGDVVDMKEIKELGYSDKLLFNFHIDYNYDKEKQELNIKKLAVGANDVGKISISLHLGNIGLDPKKILRLPFTYPQIILYKAKIDYKDESLAERYFKLEAKKEDMDLENYKRSQIQKIEKEIEKEKSKLIKKALVAIKKYIDNPKRLSIFVSPSKPQPFGRIMRTKDKDLFKLLNIQIKS